MVALVAVAVVLHASTRLTIAVNFEANFEANFGVNFEVNFVS